MMNLGDDTAHVTQYTAYLPYGELLVDEHSSSEEMPYKFNGKELDEETGLYYYGARYMQPIASVWYGVDPLTEKYTNVSGYTYCMGNPVKLVDSDGKVVKFAPGVSEQFKKNYYTAIKHLQQHGLGASLRKLQYSSRVYYIAEIKDKAIHYESGKQTIKWNPIYGLKTDNGTVMSPKSVLNHEIGHAARHEQITALKLGEIQKGRVTRTNHKGKLVITESVTSNKIKTTKKHDK